MMTKHSKQRDAIYGNLCSRTDHPTAEEIYLSLKPEMPAISLATVYRNLAQLEADSKILRIGSGGSARYDGNVSPHYHLACKGCGGVFDIFMDSDESLCERAANHFNGLIVSYSVLFNGYCHACADNKIN